MIVDLLTSIFKRATHLTSIFAVLGEKFTIFALLGKFLQSTSVRHESATTLGVAIDTISLPLLNDTSIFKRATHLTSIFAVLGQKFTIFASFYYEKK
jgi:glycerol-3-phosphate acyltransferase PlsY